jgi:hypothetical protein
VSHQDKQFRLVNLKDRDDVMDKIAKAEQEIQQMVGEPVALIAYVQDKQR